MTILRWHDKLHLSIRIRIKVILAAIMSAFVLERISLKKLDYTHNNILDTETLKSRQSR